MSSDSAGAGLNAFPNSDVLVILGSGMGDVFGPNELRPIEEFATSVAGHGGVLAACRLADSTILVSVGRRHIYEGISFEEAGALIQRAADAGVRALVVTNAAGGLAPRFVVGDIMALTGLSTIMLAAHVGRQATVERGQLESVGACRGGIDPEATRDTIHAALDRGLRLQAGIYAGVSGPSYETRAEVRMLRLIGAHAVGMSTAPEVAAARRRGMRVVGLSLITNRLSDTRRLPLDHTEVLMAGMLASERMRVAIECAVAGIRQCLSAPDR